jgi:hypothetical protein
LIVATFWTLKQGADFEAKAAGSTVVPIPASTEENPPPPPPPARDGSEDIQLRVGYTINLNLPETTNPEVFNAIFKSLKEHLLRN